MNWEAVSGGIVAASVWILPLIFAITLHEAAHAWVAWWRGDDTAWLAGRVTLNPLAHLDPFGTLILPGILLLTGSPVVFGFAKPVPVDFRRLRQPRRDTLLVAAAGPGINLILAYLSALLFWVSPLIPDVAQNWVLANLVNMIRINVILAVFNLLPVPPLDGGKVLAALLPPKLGWRYLMAERQGMLILLGLLFLLPWLGDSMGLNLNILSWIVPPVNAVLTEWILILAGLI